MRSGVRIGFAGGTRWMTVLAFMEIEVGGGIYGLPAREPDDPLIVDRLPA